MLVGENEQKHIQPFIMCFFQSLSARRASQLSSTSQPFLKGRFIFGGKGSQSSLILRVGFSRTQSRLKNKCTYLPNLKTQNTLLHMQLLHKRLHHFLIGAFRIGYTHKKSLNRIQTCAPIVRLVCKDSYLIMNQQNRIELGAIKI